MLQKKNLNSKYAKKPGKNAKKPGKNAERPGKNAEKNGNNETLINGMWRNDNMKH